MSKCRSYREESRKDWGTEEVGGLNYQQLQTGAILRIADATEAMAKRHTELIRDNEYLSRVYRERGQEIERLRRSNASLRGVITKMRKAVDKP